MKLAFPITAREFKLLARGLNPFATMRSRMYAPLSGRIKRFRRAVSQGSKRPPRNHPPRRRG